MKIVISQWSKLAFIGGNGLISHVADSLVIAECILIFRMSVQEQDHIIHRKSCLHDLAHQCLFILKYHVSTALTAAALRHDILSRQARITDRFCRHSRHHTASIEFFHLLHLPIANGRSRVGKIVPRTKPLANGYVVPHICTGT